MIDFDWYRSFLAVYRVGTVTGAAEERGLTQPAVTQHIAALEAAVGEALFTRTARRMLPTERGKLLYNRVAQPLETLEQTTRELRRPSENQPLLRLGTPREYFAEVAQARLEAAPLRLRVQFGMARGLLEALAGSELDAVIAAEQISLRGIEYRRLQDEHFVLVAGPGATPPLVQPQDESQRRELAAWLLEQPWASYGIDLPIIRRFWRQCFGQRPAIEPKLVIPDLTLIAQAVARDRAVSVLPAYLCAQALAAGRLQLLWEPPEPVTNELWLAYRAAERQRPEIGEILRRLYSSNAETPEA
ncbi:MAG: hypothetical protein OHK0022_39610 [Roseiflexaceae bacterium]